MSNLTPAYYLTASGRIPRSEYWWYFQFPITVVFIVQLLMVFGSEALADLVNVIALLMYIPLILGSIRRFHDRDKSGWWVLIALIPLVGWLWLLIELGCLKGTTGPNRYGPDPVPFKFIY